MFTHLHTHSFYSFNAGTLPATELPLLAKEAGMDALALTDTNNMSGAIEFYFACKKAGIKPILGTELKTRHERAVLLAKNNDGYREMNETLTRIMFAIPQTKPKLTLEDSKEEKVEIIADDNSYHPLAPFLSGLSDNVFVLSSSPTIITSLSQSNVPNLFLELIPSERANWDLLRELYRRHNLPVVATNNVFMKDQNEIGLQHLLRAIGTNTTIGNTPQYELADNSQCFANETSFRSMMKNLSEEAFRNVECIADQCSVEFDTSYNKFARYPCENPFELLKSLAEEGFRNRYSKPTSEHYARFEYELRMIDQLGATSYYLATHDMIQYARSKNYPYLGRGSGANSMIAYCLGICCVDPIANKLLFERFLNPERTSAPDFDIDFSWRNQHEMMNYMLERFGKENGARLCTIQCYRDRGGIREVGKALGFPDAEINELEYSVRSISRTGQIENNVSTLPDKIQWLKWADRILSFPRNLSAHTGGIIIGDRPLANYTAIQDTPSGVPISQIDMFGAEDLKLVKLDVLSIRGLGTYWDTMALVEKRHGVRPAIGEDERIAFEDEETKRIIREGKTKGCFYIESPAMIGLMKKDRTDTFDLLTIASSVIRPGVASSGMMDQYLFRRNRARAGMYHSVAFNKRDSSQTEVEFTAYQKQGKKNKIAKPVRSLLELLPDTLGVMVFQEDVLIVVHEFAGLSYAKADLFRRSMSGKLRSHERMSQMKYEFIEGALLKGNSKADAEEVWRQVSSFAGYSFCKAHSASYAVLSFREAWLKVYYPTEFLCSVLNNFGGYYNHGEYINEAKALGITVKIPDVNKSEILHTVEDDKVIRLGFEAFKGVSNNSVENLIANRIDGGEYRSIEDFAIRSGVTHEDGMTLIKLGACDSIDPNRSRSAMKFGLLSRQRVLKTKQTSLEFPVELLSFDFSDLSEPDPMTIFRREKSVLGYAVTNHPADFLKAHKTGTVDGVDLGNYDGKHVTVVGFRSSSKGVTTKAGKPMLMLNLSDETAMMDVVVWSNEYTKYYSVLASGEAFKITGEVGNSFGVPALYAETIEKLNYERGMCGTLSK